jgi:hypothetical protein
MLRGDDLLTWVKAIDLDAVERDDESFGSPSATP